jgi:hypothetical protein
MVARGTTPTFAGSLRRLLGASVVFALLLAACDRPSLSQGPADAGTPAATTDATSDDVFLPDVGIDEPLGADLAGDSIFQVPDAGLVDASPYQPPPREHEPPAVCAQAATSAVRQIIEKCVIETKESFCGRVVETFDETGCAPTADHGIWSHGAKFMACFDAESRKLCTCVRGQSVSVYLSCTLE